MNDQSMHVATLFQCLFKGGKNKRIVFAKTDGIGHDFAIDQIQYGRKVKAIVLRHGIGSRPLAIFSWGGSCEGADSEGFPSLDCRQEIHFDFTYIAYGGSLHKVPVLASQHLFVIDLNAKLTLQFGLNSEISIRSTPHFVNGTHPFLDHIDHITTILILPLERAVISTSRNTYKALSRSISLCIRRLLVLGLHPSH